MIGMRPSLFTVHTTLTSTSLDVYGIVRSEACTGLFIGLQLKSPSNGFPTAVPLLMKMTAVELGPDNREGCGMKARAFIAVGSNISPEETDQMNAVSDGLMIALQPFESQGSFNRIPGCIRVSR